MDQLEQLCKENRADFDDKKAPEGLLDKVFADLNQQTKPAGGAPRSWIKFAAAIALLISVASVVWWQSGTPEGLDVNQRFPDLVLTDMNGQHVPLSSLKGKIVLVEFWASWSTVCTEENCYYFEPVYEEYKDQGFEIYAVSMDDDKQEWLDGIERDRLPWMHVRDEAGLSSPLAEQFDLKDRALPVTYLLDRDGRVIERNIAAQELRGKLEELIAENH